MAKWTLLFLTLSLLSVSVPVKAQSYPPQSTGSDDTSTDPGSMSGNQDGVDGLSNGNQNPDQPTGDVNSDNRKRNPGTTDDNSQGSSVTSRSLPNGTYVDNAGRNQISTGRQDQRQPILPRPLTEFQLLIKASLDQTLPIFGADLFRGVPSTFAPMDQISPTADYRIGPGDELRVHVWGQVNFNAYVRVNPSGSIYLPQVGEVHVAGLAFSDLDSHVRAAVNRIFRNFDLSVELGQLRSIQVFIVGQAQRPGTYTISALSTLVNALFSSGGPSSNGSMRNIQVRRDNATITTFDLYDLLLNGDKSKDVRLLPGDVIFIPPVGPQAALAGSVRNQAIYEIKPGTTIEDLIELGGGRSAVADDSQISVERISSHHSREALQVTSDKAGLATALQDGDLVRLVSLVPRFEKTVTLRGNLANPGHFAWHSGMRLSDLLPDKEALITRNYWLRRGRLGLPVAEFESNTRIDTTSNIDQIVPGQLEIDRSAPAESTGRVVEQAVPTQVQASRGSLADAQSQVLTQNTLAAKNLTDVALTAPEIDWSYAVIERLDARTLTTSLLPFDLGKLVMDHDPAQNLELEPGDTVTIFSQADIRVPLSQQTKFVRLDGEFARSGIYSVLPGETLRQLVQRAGGFAPNSYLYGSEFTRVSARAIQQQRLDEYVQSLEVQVQRTQLSISSTAATAQDAAAASAASAPQQNLLSRLRQLRASGRIVLESKPASNDVDSLPDLALEDGDHFIIPPRPASINVVGSVYNQNSFLYSPSRRVGDYLRLAGGPTRDSDPHRAFIIRADGSVLSRNSTLTLWANSFDVLRLYPGDTLVIPAKVYKLSALRGFLDWSQLFSQFALGAAAIEVIK